MLSLPLPRTYTHNIIRIPKFISFVSPMFNPATPELLFDIGQNLPSEVFNRNVIPSRGYPELSLDTDRNLPPVVSNRNVAPSRGYWRVRVRW